MKVALYAMLTLLALQFGAIPALYAQDLTSEFIRARAEFEKGLAGDEDANLRAYDHFQQLLEKQPDHPLFMVYLGSSNAIKAGAAWMPWTKMAFADSGLDTIDKALGLLEPVHNTERMRGVPVSVETRLVAVSTFLKVPGFFNRFQNAKDILAETLEDPVFAASPPVLKSRFYLRAADAAREDGDREGEIGLLRKAVSIDPKGKSAGEARRLLKEAGLVVGESSGSDN